MATIYCTQYSLELQDTCMLNCSVKMQDVAMGLD